jgi:hypothetical protein
MAHEVMTELVKKYEPEGTTAEMKMEKALANNINQEERSTQFEQIFCN